MSAPRKSIDGWEDKNLGSLCSLINGFPFKPDDWGPDGKPIIRIQNLNGGSDYNHFDGKIDPKYEVNPGTMLFAWSGNRGTSFGPYVWSGPTGLLNQHIFKVIPSEDIHREWFFYALDEVKERVERDAHGASGLVHVRKSDLVKYPIALPKDPTEQTKIAEVLSTVDRAIEQTEALISKQQRLKTGLMQDLLTRGIDEHGNLRSEQSHKFKDSPLGRIPVEWEVVPIGGAATLQRGHDITESVLVHGPFPVVSSGGIVGWHNEYTSDGPNVVVGRKGAIGKVHYLESEFWAHDTSLYVTNFFENIPRFIFHLFVHLDLARFGTKSGSPSLNRNDVHPIRIGLPDPQEQQRIANFLDGFIYSVTSNTKALSKFQALKTALMQDLLTGRKRVTKLLPD